jgi:ATP-dependent DNA helicase RecG
METVSELIYKLNNTDECAGIEAKKGSAIDRSVMETVCAFSNEPGLGGGYILLGVEREEHSLFPQYIVTGINNPDKLQLDLSTQCGNMFNQPIRPEISIEQVAGKLVLSVFIPELPQGQKPVYFQNQGLPRGAFRRIGSADLRCTDDDLFIFFNQVESWDSSIIKDTNTDDISEEAIQLYKTLRAKVNPYAEELSYNDLDLLMALGCLKKVSNQYYLTYAGLLVFGKRTSHRRLIPMVRVDYIRVPGNEWVPDPENRFATVDMRGSLLEMVQRTFSLITDDLPKGFLLPDAALQAENIGLPSRVLREAIVNAFIHRTYRENQPIQIIRYGNRIEIKNPGFSLKPEESLGEPGSVNRNPFIAAIFHETNLAETKGSGIRTMRALMEKAHLMPPTFESDHTNNQFTVRLLLHHFLNEEDIEWLSLFAPLGLNEDQKRGLVFIREVGAVDNAAYRQLNGLDVLKASGDLRALRDKNILEQKGKGRSTYYIPGLLFNEPVKYLEPQTAANAISVHPSGSLTAPPHELTAPPHELTAPPDELTAPVNRQLFNELPPKLQALINELPERINNPAILENVIIQLCDWKSMNLSELSSVLGRTEKYLLRTFIAPLRESGQLEYQFPEMPNHPQQAYKTKQS